MRAASDLASLFSFLLDQAKCLEDDNWGRGNMTGRIKSPPVSLQQSTCI